MSKETPAPKRARKPKSAAAPKAKRKSPSARKRKGETTPAEDAHEVLMDVLAQSEGAPASAGPIQPEPKSPAAHLAAYRFQPGQSGNPKGKPKGSRNKLGEAFLTDLQADWAEHGAAAIAVVRVERPQDYLKVVASILPKQVDVRVSEFDEMEDADLDRRIRQLAALLEIGVGEAPGRTETAH